MARDLVAGVDSSTQSCTVMLRRLDDGATVAEARAPHPPTTPPVSEQDPRIWWSALELCLAELREHLDRVAAISVGGQGHGLVMLDGHDQPLRPAKLWNDTESAPDAMALLDKLPATEWARRTGSVPAPALTVSKLAWTQRNLPGLLAKAKRIMLPFDYLIYRLSGHAVTERGGSSGTGYFNPFDNAWDFDLANLGAPGIDWAAALPEIISSDGSSGAVAEAAGLGELTGAAVGAGTGDNMTAALGIAIRKGDTVISLGTSGTLYGLTDTGIRDASGSINGYADATGAFLPMVTTLNAAKVTDTFRRLLGATVDEFDALALSAPAGSDGLVLIPYLDGERTPNLPFARGTLSGLSTATSRACLARAAIEGVVCGLLEGGELLKRNGVAADGRLIVTGGGSRSRSYRQILADLTGRSVWICPIAETAAAGAAVQAAAALTGTPSQDIAAAWAKPLECVAEPTHGAWASAASTRESYSNAAECYAAGR